MKTIFVREISIALVLTTLFAVGIGAQEPGTQEPGGASLGWHNENDEPSQPLYLGLPFDRLTLTSHYNGASFDVRPVEFENGRRPNPLPRIGDLIVRFVNNPLKEYTVKWNFVESIELFCELVFKEFQQRLESLVEQTRSLTPEDASWASLSSSYEEIYDYLLYLEDFKDELPQLSAAYDKFLFEEAVYRVKSGDYPTGLTRFESVFHRNKNYSGLPTAWGAALSLMLEEKTKAEEFVSARKQLLQFKKFYPDHPVAKEWEERIRRAAQDRFDRSHEAVATKEFLAAHYLCEEAYDIAPELNGLDAWRRQLQRDAPRINVAVQNPSDGARLADWGTLRRQRLFQRTLTEYVQPDTEGGIYVSPFGTLEKSDRNRTLRWKIAPHWTEQAEPINAFAVADALLRLTESEPLWSELLASIDITSPDELVVRLSRSHLLPEAIFNIPVPPATRFAVPSEVRDSKFGVRVSGGGVWATVPSPFEGGLGRADQTALPPPPSTEEKEGLSDHRSPFPRVGFQRCAATESGPTVIVEYTVDRSEDAVNLLLDGKIDVIDRVAPWELERLQRDSALTTGHYAVPTLCFLVPNLRKPLSGNRTFRRALLYGLNRERMLEKFLSKGVDATIVSGPFLKGTSLGDPLGYAYDTSIAPRPYEPKLALAITLLAFSQVKEKNPSLQRDVKIPEIVLARPTHETAQFACLMIRRQWEAIGVPVREVDYRSDEQIGSGTDVDFWFVERTVKEPLVEVEALFGRLGLLGGGSSYMELALAKLRQAEDWPTAARCLREIHRLCFEETTVLPLWQISEHFAHRVEYNGVRSNPPIFDLYQNVERWNVR